MEPRAADAPPTAGPTANASRVDHGRGVAAAVALLAGSNVATNRLLPESAYVPWNLGLAVALLGLARRGGGDRAALGLDADDLPRGLATGAVGAAVVTAGYGLVAAVAPQALHDDRASGLTPGRARFQALVRIPLGTVVAEEIAFRGVLPALLAAPRRPRWWPGLVSSVAFGLWHVLPSRDLATANAGAERLAARTGPAGPAALAVAATTAAGGLLHVLRRRGRHLAAPMLVHAATNVVGLVAARWADGHRLAADPRR